MGGWTDRQNATKMTLYPFRRPSPGHITNERSLIFFTVDTNYIHIHVETQGGQHSYMDIPAATWAVTGDKTITGSKGDKLHGVIVLSIERNTGFPRSWVSPFILFYTNLP